MGCNKYILPRSPGIVESLLMKDGVNLLLRIIEIGQMGQRWGFKDTARTSRMKSILDRQKTARRYSNTPVAHWQPTEHKSTNTMEILSANNGGNL
jgi:hypothetical protein